MESRIPNNTESVTIEVCGAVAPQRSSRREAAAGSDLWVKGPEMVPIYCVCSLNMNYRFIIMSRNGCTASSGDLGLTNKKSRQDIDYVICNEMVYL